MMKLSDNHTATNEMNEYYRRKVLSLRQSKSTPNGVLFYFIGTCPYAFRNIPAKPTYRFLCLV